VKYEIDCEKGIAGRGNLARLKRVMKKAREGASLTVGFLGGSITQGSLSSAPELCYAHRVYDWWRKTFPDAEFTYVNAGIGGTTSQFGAARVSSDLLTYHPDFVIVEFAVNDESSEHFLETYEGVVRQVYADADAPALLLVYNVYYHNGANAQLQHSKIGRHYSLPAVSMQSSIYPEVVAGRIENRSITPDDLHPNDDGHELVAGVITHFLDKVAAELEQGEEPEPAMPQPLTKNRYEDSIRHQNGNITPELMGFEADSEPQQGITDCFKNGWTARREGDAIRFQVEGSCIAVQFRQTVKRPAPVAVAVIDGEEEIIRLDANFEEDWGDNLALVTVLEEEKPEVHTVEIRIVEAHEEDVLPFYLVSVISSGR